MEGPWRAWRGVSNIYLQTPGDKLVNARSKYGHARSSLNSKLCFFIISLEKNYKIRDLISSGEDSYWRKIRIIMKTAFFHDDLRFFIGFHQQGLEFLNNRF